MCVVGYGAPGRADWAGVVRRRREGAYEVGTIVVVYLDNEKRLGQDRVIATTKRCSTASLTG